METIELSPLDKKDLLELLDYASKKKQEEKPFVKGTQHWDDRKYWKLRICQLEALIKGYRTMPGVQSSFETIDYSMNEKEKQQLRYRNSLESDLEEMLTVKEEWKY